MIFKPMSLSQFALFERRRRRGGVAVVEMALVLPVLLGIVIGIMEISWLAKNTLTVSNASREGARAASLGADTATIQSRIQNSVAPLVVTSPTGSILLRWSDNDGADNFPYAVSNLSGSTTRNAVPAGKLIRVTVTSNPGSLTGFFPFLKNRPTTAFVIMRRE